MSVQEKSTFLENYYFNPNNPAAYTSPEKLYQALKSNKQFRFTKHFISKWLRKQDSYTLQRQTRRPSRVPNIRVSGINVQWSMDLMDVQNLAKENDGINYLLILIDVFTKYLRVVPLQTKSARSVRDALKAVFESGLKCQKLRSDMGREFNNSLVKTYLKDQGVNLFFATNNSKAAMAERVIRTLRGRLFRYFQKNRTYRYLDILPQLVSNYNSTPHRSLNDIAPKDVDKDNEADVWAFMYLKGKRRPKSKKISSIKRKKRNIIYKFKLNQLVRLSHLKHVFHRGYQQQFTGEIFKIYKRFHIQGIPMYKVKDFNGDIIDGNFYQSDLQAVDKAQDALWIIEKLIKKRRRKGATEWLVKYESWPDKFNEWVNESDIVDVKS